MGKNYAPYKVSFIEDKAVVTDCKTPEAINPSGLKTGDIIVSINKRPLEDIVKSNLLSSPVSNITAQLYAISKKLLWTNSEKLNLEIIRNGKTLIREITCYPDTEFALYSMSQTERDPYSLLSFDASHIYKIFQASPLPFNLLSLDVGYIYPTTLGNSLLPSVMEIFKDTKGLIIDLRCGLGTGFAASTLGAYLTPEPVDFAKTTNGSLIHPGMFTFGKTLQTGKRDMKGYYKGKIVIIINEMTQGSAESHAMAFRTAPRATVIGSATAGYNGNISEILLPGNVHTFIPGIGVYYPDGRETQRTGIMPDIEVKPTIRGIIEGRDELLEKAIEIIKGQ